MDLILSHFVQKLVLNLRNLSDKSCIEVDALARKVLVVMKWHFPLGKKIIKNVLAGSMVFDFNSGDEQTSKLTVSGLNISLHFTF